MLAVSESHLSKLLLSLDHSQCHRLLKQLLNALGAFSAQQQQQQQDNTKTGGVPKTIHQPARTSIVSDKWGSTTLFMPVSDGQSTGFKVVTVPRPTTTTSKPDSAVSSAIRGVINILSPDGRLEGVLSAAEITAFRTALATMIPFTRCAWIRKKRIVIFGSGKQAEWHARLALLAVADPKDIEEITFINRSHGRLDSTITATLFPDLRQRYPHLVLNAYSREQEEAKRPDGENAYRARVRADLARSDAIFCCTPSTTPLFTYDDLLPTATTATTSADQTAGSGPESESRPQERFISLIGSYKPHMQEIDSRTLLSGPEGTIYVDSIEACMQEAGELITAKVDASRLTELGELAAAGEDGAALLPQRSGNVIFKCVGMGIMDLAIARSLLSMAYEQGYGTVVDGF